ncbi:MULTISPECIES: glycosyltransferase family protein [Bacillus cereus group]|uniref:Streptomycin biosynthesis protein StrF n=1 Tax=Bacillus proteolyticus TaxID=2026192 RepID=A0ABV3IEB0_9BACI|nr:glycosyltransferase family protein [Bacillus cereus group sp. N8]MBJ8104029.1 glycosyltransferase family protein [Bacillus cereus group sp. N8]
MNTDEKTILFVTCVNDQKMYAKCVNHILNLAVPDSYKLDFFPILRADSMTSGYNKAVSHPAKYKVYLHQDVFIVNHAFLYEMLNLFNSHEHLGMIGMVGAQYVPPNGLWHEGRGVVGKVMGYMNNLFYMATQEKIYHESKTFIPVEVIDGLLMATQYDVTWRDDLLDGFHFYDLSQSFEFREKGYTVGVPVQRDAWCIHYHFDINMTNYEKYRKIFVEHYMSDVKQEE